MGIGVVRGFDLVAVAGAALSGAMAVTYLGLMAAEGDTPLWWVLLVLGVGVVAGLAGAPTAAAGRRVVLLGGGLLLVALGVLAILSIGLPILLAGGLLIGSSTR